MHKINQNFNEGRGLTLVEIIIATSIILTFLVALFGVYNFYLKAAFSSKNTIKASFLAEEGLEVVRFLKNSAWSTNIASLSLDTDYYLVFENGEWVSTSTPILIDGIFDRTVVFSEVYRDVSGDITSSGGTLDPNTIMVVSTVSWPKGEETVSRSIATYLTNIFDN